MAKSFRSIIDIWGPAEFARLLGVPKGTATSWGTRDVIPPEHWLEVTRMAKQAGHPEVTAELLARLAAERGPHGQRSSAA